MSFAIAFDAHLPGRVFAAPTRTTTMNLKALSAVSVIACGAVFGTHATAAGVGTYKVTTTNDTFDNSGQIRSYSEASGGMSTAISAQRVISPFLAVNFEYRSQGNRYRNSGVIEATSRASGGLSTSISAQDVVR